MQNEEYYNAYMKEWNKILKGQKTVTEAERRELKELLQKQNTQKGVDSNVH